MYVTKRDGRQVLFNTQKIENAIGKAYWDKDWSPDKPNPPYAGHIADEIKATNRDYTVEQIQDLVEQKLMSYDPAVAKAYILYRNKRTQNREQKSRIVEAVKCRLEARKVQNSNANVDERSFSGREKESQSDIHKIIALEDGSYLSEEVASAHKNMLLYQHDLEKAPVGEHNCLNIDFKKLFTEGFETRNGDIRVPTSFSTACQHVAVIFQCQSQVQFGGVGSVHIDYDLEPFVKMSFAKHFLDGMEWIADNGVEYDKKELERLSIDSPLYDEQPKVKAYAMAMLKREMKQSAEALYHNLNSLESRAGSQVPFTSINFGRDTTPEGRMVSEAMLQASLAGIGKFHRTAIFPISIFQYKAGNNANPADPNYDLKQLALESLSKRIYPNFCNCDWSQAHEDLDDPDTYFSTMGCRTMLGYDRHGLGYRRVGRGNNVPNTIILPKLGIEYGIALGKRDKADLEGFWMAFEETLKLAEQGLLERFDVMVNQAATAAPFMYQNGTIADGQKCNMSVYQSLKHNTLAIGYIGIAEMCEALFGVNHARSKEAHAFALSVVQRINEFAKEASERNDLNFSCYATPAEGLCSTALKALRRQYGIIPRITDREFITNSHHVPVWEEVGIFDKLEIEAPFCKYPTGGCITYVELDATFVQNTKAIEQIIDYAFKTLDIPYLAFNFPIDSCLDCGHQGEFNDRCPECGSTNIQQLRRVTGYLTTDYRKFNEGKQDEVLHRFKHSRK